jgi:hypothetical protein
MAYEPMLVDTIEYKGHKIKVYYDECAGDLNPRAEDYNFGNMVCYHSRYNLGDQLCKENFPEPEDFIKWMKSQGKEVISLPIFLYDHSGICMNTSGYSCPWDSGQVGWIYVTRKEAREEMMVSRITQKQKDKIIEWLKGEVEYYSQYIQGNVYYYDACDENDDSIDCCSGFIGDDLETNGLLEQAREAIDYNIEKRVMSADGKVVGTEQQVLDFFGVGEGA